MSLPKLTFEPIVALINRGLLHGQSGAKLMSFCPQRNRPFLTTTFCPGVLDQASKVGFGLVAVSDSFAQG